MIDIHPDQNKVVITDEVITVFSLVYVMSCDSSYNASVSAIESLN